MDEIKTLFLNQHLRDNKVHSGVSTGETGWHQHKHYVFTKSSSTFYIVSKGDHPKTKIQGNKLLPPRDKQRDALIEQVITGCSICAKMRKERATLKEQDIAMNKEWQTRYEHVIVEKEYESVPTHVADDTCANCHEKAGRRGRIGKRYGDKTDLDDLHNCDGCTKALHYDCRPYLEQDNPENRRPHRLPADVPLTFARRYEPWLCADCWSNAGPRQLQYDRDVFEAKVRRHQQRRAEKRARLAASKASSSVNSSNCSEDSDDSEPEPFMGSLTFLEYLKKERKLEKQKKKSEHNTSQNSSQVYLQLKLQRLQWLGFRV